MPIAVRCCLALFSISTLCSAAAEAEPDYFRSGPYVGVGAVLGLDNFRGNFGGTSTAGGAEVRVGYRMTKIFSAELVGEFMDDQRYLPPGPWPEARVWHVSANVKGSVDLRRLGDGLGRIQPYGVVGVGYYQAWLHGAAHLAVRDASVRDGMARIGAGVDVHLTEHVLVGFEARYNALFNGRRGLDSWSLGLGPQLRF